MRGDDPDAMWRPGYTGSYGYPSATRPRPRRRRRRWAAVAGTVSLVAGATGVALLLTRDGGDHAARASGPRIGVAAEARWQATLDGIAVTGAAGSADEVVVLTGAVGPELVALDATTGAQRWRLDLPAGRIDSVAVIDDVVVVSQTGQGDTATVAGVPIASGEIAWTHPIEQYDTVADEGGATVAVVGATRIELLDVRDGTTSATIDGDVSWSRSIAQRRRGERLEVLDRATLRPSAVVDLGVVGVGDGVDALAAVTPDGIVVATPDAVLLLDPTGTRPIDDVRAGQYASGSVGLEVLDDAGLVAVQHGDRLAVLSTDGGALRPRWSDTAWLVDWRVNPTHRLVAAARVLGSIISMPPVVVDAETGRQLWDGPAVVQRSSPLQVFADDGFVHITTGLGIARVPVVVGYDLDRREVWRRPIDSASRVHVVDRGFVTIDDDPESGVTVTLYA